jgi:hypothetical protein
MRKMGIFLSNLVGVDRFSVDLNYFQWIWPYFNKLEPVRTGFNRLYPVFTSEKYLVRNFFRQIS